MASKVDGHGAYTRFPGVTVVASSYNSEENVRFWNELYEELRANPLVTNHFALLPPESYHMTTINLLTQQMLPQNEWDGMIDTKLRWMQQLHHALAANGFSPKVELERVQVSGVIIVYLRLDEEQKEAVRKLAKEFNIEQCVSDPYHVTIGYKYAATTDQQIAELYTALGDIFTRRMKHRMFFDVPKLCYFQDMTAFIPWDGQSNPFRNAAV
jgi:hypothetical protein